MLYHNTFEFGVENPNEYSNLIAKDNVNNAHIHSLLVFAHKNKHVDKYKLMPICNAKNAYVHSDFLLLLW